MVGMMSKQRLDVATLLLVILLAWTAYGAAAQAAVIASVDRSNVELNESFTFKVTVDTAIDVEPNADALQQDFYVGTRSQLSNTTIVNGQISRSRTWTYVLMAKREGNLLIPPVIVGAEQSEPVPVMIAPPSNSLPGEADIFVTAEVDYDESFVQAQVIYTVKVYRAVATRQPRLSEPNITGVEVLIEGAGDERSYDAVLNGKDYKVVERVYALFPQESGEISITPARFEARVLRDGRITGRKIYESAAINIVVNPIPPPPDGFAGAAWFPAKAVTLREDWSRDPGSLPAGEPITRHITVTALGQLSTQIPVLDPTVSDTVKIYPDKPEFRDTAEVGGIRAIRRDQYALIGVESGDVVLPELNLPWWNIDTREWQIARLPGTTLSILPSANMRPVPSVAAATIAPDEEQETAPATVVYSDMWRRISEGLVILWVLTLVVWWWSRRPVSIEKEPVAPPLHKQLGKYLKNARKAALAGDLAGVKSALLDWGRLQWPDDMPRSVGNIATRVSLPLSTQLETLCKASYGKDDTHWDGEALAKALRSFSVLTEKQAERPRDILPPLVPG